MMARYTSADVIVVGLIGERGREVKEFVERILGPEGRRRSVVVASPGRQSAADPPARRLARHVHCRIFSRARTVRAAHHGFVDAIRPGAARDRPRHRRSAGHAWLSAVGVRAASRAGRARRQRRDRARLDHRVLYGAHRRRRPAGSDRRRGARHPRRPRRAVAAHRRSRAVPGHRRRSLGEPRDARNHPARTRRAGAPLPPDPGYLPAASRSHLHRRVPEGQRSARRRRHRAVAGDAEIPHAAHRGACRAAQTPCKRCAQLFATSQPPRRHA